MKKTLCILICLLAACSRKEKTFDAEGSFEADEVIVSSELPGKLSSFHVQEGQNLEAGVTVGNVDALPIALQKEQVEASIHALSQKTMDVNPQIKLLQDQLSVQETQLQNLQQEKARIERLLKQDAATGKQLDDIRYQIDAMNKQMLVTKQQIAVQISNVNTQNRSILSEAPALQKKAAQLNDQIQRSAIINPIKGTVLTKYAQPGEITAAGKALYKIASLDTLTLRAYVTGDQLPLLKLGQSVKVYTDKGSKEYKEQNGIISWIADKAEFTPKTIQTKEERANLVYAVKVRVKNDGSLKIGMYADVKF
jgi:HlyD family secretion protein